MIINHNLSALNACNKLNSAAKSKSNAMEKVSSGMRINEAADDAAGSSISEKMKAQIRGLEQAGENIQNGISLVQTAEAGLGSIQNPNLQRMRELILQALNGTLKQSDRMIIQNELENIKGSINDIANNTEFNTIKLLAPPTNISESSSPSSAGKADIVFVVDNTSSMNRIQTNVASNINNFINQINSQGVSDIRMGIVEYEDSTINDLQFSGSKWTSNNSDISNVLSSLVNEGGTENAMAALSDAVDNYDFRDNGNGTQTKHIILITDEDADDDTVQNVASTLSKLKSKGIQMHGVYNTDNHEAYTPGVDNDDVTEFDDLIQATGGKKVNLQSSDWGNQLSSIIGTQIGSSGSGTKETQEKMPTLELQVGANSGQEFQVELFDARTKHLGIDDVKVDPIEEAEQSLGKVDRAIDLVSSQRAKFGTYQNALEHIEKNVDNYGGSVSSAESRITDADMAKEIMEVTKSSIIEQSAQSILKQAEKMPESVINLMDKWQGGKSTT